MDRAHEDQILRLAVAEGFANARGHLANYREATAQAFENNTVEGKARALACAVEEALLADAEREEARQRRRYIGASP